MQKAKLIVIEGLDGSGKATQTKMLCNYLTQRGRNHRQISFPDYSEKSSTAVQMYLHGEIGTLDEVNAYAASSFFAIDRYISFKRLWETDYRREDMVIVADRYATSNIVHQMEKLPPASYDTFIAWLEQYEYELLGIPKPDLVLYLDMDPNTSRKLLEKRYAGDETQKDIHESNFVYLQHCRDAALYAARKLNWHVIRCCDGSEPYPVERIFRAVQQIIDTEVL